MTKLRETLLQGVRQTTTEIESPLVDTDDPLASASTPTGPLADVTLHARGTLSVSYQSVQYGVSLTYKDVPIRDLEKAQDRMAKRIHDRMDQLLKQMTHTIDDILREREQRQ